MIEFENLLLQSISKTSLPYLSRVKIEILERKKVFQIKYYNKRNINYIESNNNLFWWDRPTIQNFGDYIGPYLFEKITGHRPHYSFPSYKSKETVFFAVGSIIGASKSNSIIWGSGIMHSKELFPKPFSVLAVRGPYTRKRFLELGYNCPEIYGDPAILLPKYYTPKTDKKYLIGITPHYKDYELVYDQYKGYKEIIVINMTLPIETVIDIITSCKYTISSSLHGTIVSHAYQIPSVVVRFSKKLLGDGIKFLDYFESLDLKVTKIANLINYSANIVELQHLVENSVQPEFPLKLCKPLMDSCPFKKK